MREGGLKQKKEEPTRRDFIRRAAIGAVALTGMSAAGMLEKSIQDARKDARKAPDWMPKEGESFLEAERKPRLYDTSTIAGVVIGPGLNRYIGLPRKERRDAKGNIHHYYQAEKQEELDFKYQLALMLQRKLELIRGDESMEEFSAHDRGEAIVKAMQSMFDSYVTPEPGHGPSVEDFTTYVDRVIGDTASKLDLTRIESHFKMKSNQMAVFERLATTISGDLLLAYSMTELMPSHNGVENVRAYEFLLQNAGRGYLERIPALGDRLISFGPYQFTDMAIEADVDEKMNARIHSASAIDATQEQRLLPPNVVSLRGDDHYRAAHLFALYNFVVLVKNLGDERCSNLPEDSAFLNRAAKDFLIAAHHRPANAVEAFKKLLLAHKTQPEATLERFCAADVAVYLKKSHANEAALEKRVAMR